MFPIGGVSVATSTSSLRGDGGRIFKRTTTARVSGQLLGSGAQEISRLQYQLEAVLSQEGADMKLLDENGAATSVRLLSKGAEFPGVVVTSFDFPEPGNGDMVTGRAFTFTAEATYPAGKSNVISYSEAVDTQGTGGPKINWQQSFNGSPLPVRLYPVTMTTVVQSGQAVGYYDYPNIPSLVLPEAYLDSEVPAVRRSSPKINGTEFPIAWRYVFRFPGRLTRSLFPTILIG